MIYTEAWGCGVMSMLRWRRAAAAATVVVGVATGIVINLTGRCLRPFPID
jgi:hypothetical protein